MLEKTIGIDAKWYFNGPPSGKRVVQNLVDSLLKKDHTTEYVIFLRKADKRNNFPHQNKNIKLVHAWAGNNLLSNVFVLPWYIRKYKIQTTLYQNFISPFDLGKAIAYIHDVLFLSNPEFYTFTERVYFWPLKILTRMSDTVVTVSYEEKKRLLDFGYKKNEADIHVVHHGVDNSFKPLEFWPETEINELREKYNLPEKFILFVGRLNLRKNVDNLLKAVPLLRNKDIKLVVVGDEDWKKSNHSETIAKLNISDRLIFTGAIYKDLGVVYAMSAVFCFPSFAESFGLPALEAMASGIPVVVSNTTALPEICGDAGNYASPENPAEIAAQVDNLLENENLYRKHQELGLNQAKLFTWDDAASKLIALFQQMVT